VWVLVRAVIWATLFVSLVLVFLPVRVLRWPGITAVPAIGAWQVVGTALAGVGAAIAVWRILTFVFLGKGTPAPFDPPRRLVVRGLRSPARHSVTGLFRFSATRSCWD
jgi:hypothetical protein